jgi:uncharacterized protein YaaN involved in tellurite resistance
MSETTAPQGTVVPSVETPTNTAIAQRVVTMPPPMPADLVSYQSAPPERRAEIDQAMTELDIDDSKTILTFGTAAQEEVTSVADEMLEGVKNKDTGVAGQTLNELVVTLRGFSAQDLDPKHKPGLIKRLLGARASIAKVLAAVRQVARQVDEISNRLDSHTSMLMKDVGMLDRPVRADASTTSIDSRSTSPRAKSICAAWDTTVIPKMARRTK